MQQQQQLRRRRRRRQQQRYQGRMPMGAHSHVFLNRKGFVMKHKPNRTGKLSQTGQGTGGTGPSTI